MEKYGISSEPEKMKQECRTFMTSKVTKFTVKALYYRFLLSNNSKELYIWLLMCAIFLMSLISHK